MPGRARSLRSAAAAGAAAMLLSACSPPDGSPASDPPPNTLRIGLGQVLSGPTQGLAALAQPFTVESLARLADDGRPQPWLARDWQVSDDRRALTVNFAPGLTFHDGTPVTSAIVADALKSSLPAFMSKTFEDVESVTASGPQQVVIRLRRPSPFLLDTLETSIAKPGSPLVGTGPFELTEAKLPNELRANEHYLLGKPAIDRITFETFSSVRAAWAEMLRGRLDMLYEVAPDALDSLQASNSIATFTHTRRFQYLIVLNRETPVFKSTAIRQALNLAIDRDALVRDALGGHGVVSSGPVWPHSYGFRGGTDILRRDLTAAAKLLSRDSSRGKGAALHFTCTIRPDAVHERIALVIKRQLAEVGIDMSIEQVTMDAAAEVVKNRRFEAVLTEMISGPAPLRLYRMWHSGGVAGATSPVVDAALDRVRYAASESEYSDSISALQQAAIDDPPAIFLAWMERARAVSKRFIVPAAEPGRDIMSNLRLWKPSGIADKAGQN